MFTAFTNSGTTEVRSGFVDVPMLSCTRGSAQEILAETISPAPVEIREDPLGNRTGRFSLADIPAASTLIIRQEYRILSSAVAGNRLGMEPRPEHLRAETKVEIDAPEIQALASLLAREAAGGQLPLARRIAEETQSLIKYDRNSPARNQGALAGLKSSSGVCEEYATLFTALSRAAGLPARVVHGFARDRDSASSAWTGVAGTDSSLAPYRHAWAEVFIQGTGWLAVDPTYNRGEIGAAGMREIAPGTFIVEGYANNPVSGRYVGGKLQAERKETLDW
jgi:transglutaminase-like putative cysteine protease